MLPCSKLLHLRRLCSTPNSSSSRRQTGAGGSDSHAGSSVFRPLAPPEVPLNSDVSEFSSKTHSDVSEFSSKTHSDVSEFSSKTHSDVPGFSTLSDDIGNTRCRMS